MTPIATADPMAPATDSESGRARRLKALAGRLLLPPVVILGLATCSDPAGVVLPIRAEVRLPVSRLSQAGVGILRVLASYQTAEPYDVGSDPTAEQFGEGLVGEIDIELASHEGSEVAVPLELGECLADPEHMGGADECVIDLWISARAASGELIDRWDLRGLSLGPGGTRELEILLDGRWLLFNSGPDGEQDLFRVRPDGTGLTRLTDDDAFYGRPSLSPDGTRLLFISDLDGDVFTGDVDIFVSDSDGSDPVNISGTAGFEDTPVWSPDGSRIAFVAVRDGVRDLFTMNPDGTGVSNLTADHDLLVLQAPDWSPDGARIAYHAFEAGDGSVYVISADGSDLVRITDGLGIESWPSWSPDGTRIAFSAAAGHNEFIYIVDADGSNASQLTPAPGLDFWPAWSPDGSQIAFSAYRGGTGSERHIYLIDPDGSNLARVLDRPVGPGRPAWSTVSPLVVRDPEANP